MTLRRAIVLTVATLVVAAAAAKLILDDLDAALTEALTGWGRP